MKKVWPQRSLKFTKVHPILALTQPFPIMDVPLMLPSQIVCISLFFLTLHLVLYSPLFLLLSLYIPLYLPLLLHFYVAWFLMIFRSFKQITTLTNHFNLNLRSYGQLFVVLVFYFLSNHPRINFGLIFVQIILFRAIPNLSIEIFSDSKHSVYIQGVQIK